MKEMHMSLAKTLRCGVIAAIGASAIAVAAPASAGVIVKSSGPSAASFPVGKKMKDTDRITLKAGDTVTILTSGGTRVLKGSGTYRVGARGTSQRVRFANLTRRGSASRVTTGATRSGQGEVRSPNLWYVDVTKSGKMCVSDLANVTLWRPEIKDDQTFIVGPKANDFHYHVTFDGSASTRRIDSERLALQEGAEYSITGPGGAEVTNVTFAVIEDTPNNAEAMAQSLIAKGCTLQLDLLAASLEPEAR